MRLIILLLMFITNITYAKNNYKPGDKFLVLKDIYLECNSSAQQINHLMVDTLLIWPTIINSNRFTRCKRLIPKHSIYEITEIKVNKKILESWTELKGNLILSNKTTFESLKKSNDWKISNDFGDITSNNLKNIKIQMRGYNLDLNNKDLNTLYYKKVN